MLLLGKIIVACYLFILIVLSLYGLHRLLLVTLYYLHKRKVPQPAAFFEKLPQVTVQLPVFNELYVVRRLVEAVCQLDYPREKMRIQLLDDSTDETVEICRQVAEEKKALGFDIMHLHRADRTGFKAGALNEGLDKALGDFVVMFDADFVPKPDFIQRCIHFFTDPRVAAIQVRWGHINRDYSLLTEIQSIYLDGHFVLEHTARNRSGRFMNFSGTAGLWRRQAIEDAGGWEYDTLTEDLDLSLRAQLKGWKLIYLPELVSPAELPAEMNAFKSQQHRWAKGAVQTSRKLLGAIWRSRASLKIKIEATFHLTGNFSYLLMFMLSLLVLPATIVRGQLGWHRAAWLDVIVFVCATISVCFFYLCAQREVHRQWLPRVRYLPMLLSLGIGMCVSNSKAVLEALVGHRSEFVRTPKFALAVRRDKLTGRKYLSKHSQITYVELMLGLYYAGTITFSAVYGLWGAIPFQALFMLGFFYVALLSLFQPRTQGATG